MIDKKFWQGKRVFITGHTGFKGGWLSLWLQNMGAEVKGYALAAPAEPTLFHIARIAEKMTSELGDIRDYQKISASLRQFNPNIVFHLAAQPLVRHSYSDPIATYETNVMGTLYLLEAVRQLDSIKAVINITSDKCYENKEWVWGYRENEPMGGLDPYSNSKGCSELVTAAYRHSFFNSKEGISAIATARAGNVIGGGDWAQDRIVPDILRAFSSDQPVIIRHPHAIRPWQHVLEPLSGYLLLAEKLYQEGEEYAQAWNFGPLESDAISVKTLVEKMATLWGGRAHWQVDERAHPYEAHSLKLDCSKAKMELGWQPRWDLDATLKRIVKWHQTWLTGKDMHDYTINEINDYMNQDTE